jgi:hypothetical protein
MPVTRTSNSMIALEVICNKRSCSDAQVFANVAVGKVDIRCDGDDETC